MTRLCSAAAGLAILFTAAAARAQDPPADTGSAPVLRYPPSSVRPKLIAGGLALTAAAYGGAYLCAANWPEVPGSDALKIPVVGPWIALVQNDCAADDPDCGFTLYFRGILTVIDGLIQAGGLGIVGEGIFMTTEANAPPKKKTDAAGLTVRPAPILTAHTTGVGFVGTF